MLSDIYQKLTSYFRSKYISSLQSFVVKLDPLEIKPEIHRKLSNDIKTQLDIEKDANIHYTTMLKQDKQRYDEEAVKNDGYALKDVNDGFSYLRMGTNYTDEYYPYFVFNYSLPERTPVQIAKWMTTGVWDDIKKTGIDDY